MTASDGGLKLTNGWRFSSSCQPFLQLLSINKTNEKREFKMPSVDLLSGIFLGAYMTYAIFGTFCFPRFVNAVKERRKKERDKLIAKILELKEVIYEKDSLWQDPDYPNTYSAPYKEFYR